MSRVITLSPLPNNATALSVLGDGNCWLRSTLVALGISTRPFVHEVNHMMLRRMVVDLASSHAEDWMFEGTEAGTKTAWIRELSASGTYADQLFQQYTAVLLGVSIRVHVGARIDTYNPGCAHSIDIVMVMNVGVYNHFDVWTTSSEAEIRRALRAFDADAVHVDQAAFRAAIARMQAPVNTHRIARDGQALKDAAAREKQSRIAALGHARRLAAYGLKLAAEKQALKDAEYARKLAAEEEQSRKDAEYARKLAAAEEQSVRDAEYARSLFGLA